MIADAPVALVVCGDTRAEKHPGYWVQDCSAAIQNVARRRPRDGTGRGLIGVHPVEERVENVRAIVGCPEGIVPMSMIALGHPAEGKPAGERFTPDFVHLDRWNP